MCDVGVGLFAGAITRYDHSLVGRRLVYRVRASIPLELNRKDPICCSVRLYRV